MSETSDPLATLVSGISFTNLETDIVSAGVAIMAFYIIFVGVRWILRMVHRA